VVFVVGLATVLGMKFADRYTSEPQCRICTN